jgi:hypothetical protein
MFDQNAAYVTMFFFIFLLYFYLHKIDHLGQIYPNLSFIEIIGKEIDHLGYILPLLTYSINPNRIFILEII